MAQDLVKQKGAGSGGANISANAVFGSRLAASDGEPFRSLESIISIADKVVFSLCLGNVLKHRKKGSTPCVFQIEAFWLSGCFSLSVIAMAVPLISFCHMWCSQSVTLFLFCWHVMRRVR